MFTRTLAELYISFDLRHVDWQRTIEEQRDKITVHTTPAELFHILSTMIAPLNDIHTGIEAAQLNSEFGPPMKAGSDRLVHGNLKWFATNGRRQLAKLKLIDREYLSRPVVRFCRGQWEYGLAGEGIGYLRILQFREFREEDKRQTFRGWTELSLPFSPTERSAG